MKKYLLAFILCCFYVPIKAIENSNVSSVNLTEVFWEDGIDDIGEEAAHNEIDVDNTALFFLLVAIVSQEQFVRESRCIIL